MTDIETEIERLSRLGYHRVISGEPTDGYLAEVLELAGCATAGETPEEALRNLDEAMAAWFEAALKRGMAIPEPSVGRVLLGA